MFAAGALYAAAMNDSKRLAELLVQYPNMVNEVIGNDAATPLHGATFKNNTKSVKILLEAQADPNAVKEAGASPAFSAAQYGSNEALHLLLQAAADPNLSRHDASAPLHMAVQSKGKIAVKLLLRAAANIEQTDMNGYTALFYAAQGGDLDIVKVLLKEKSNVNHAAGIMSTTALSLAADDTIVNALLDARADPTTLSRSSSLASRGKSLAFSSHFGAAFGGTANSAASLHDAYRGL